MGAIVTGAAITAAGVLASSKMQSSASKNATKAQTGATNRAMSIEERAEAQRLEEARRVEAQNQRNWEVEQAREQGRYQTSRDDALRGEAQGNARWAYDERRREPYRAAGRGAVRNLSDLAGIQGVPGEAPPDWSQGWDSASLSPERRTGDFVPPPEPTNRTLPGGRRLHNKNYRLSDLAEV